MSRLIIGEHMIDVREDAVCIDGPYPGWQPEGAMSAVGRIWWTDIDVLLDDVDAAAVRGRLPCIVTLEVHNGDTYHDLDVSIEKIAPFLYALRACYQE